MSGWASGEKCLVKDQDHGWATAVVTGSQGIGSQATLKLRLDDGGVLLEKQGSDVERLTNDRTLEETEDMAALENLSEATMLECLRRRYRRDRIYSSLGGVVVAINPFRKIDHLYEDGYARFGAGDDANLLKPHPYALAESAVRGVVRDRTSQSLLVSGESGAGKTETVKIMLGYIAKRSHRAKGTSASPGVDDALIAANPLLEAFANATTVRNGNSSRFGKFVRVFVDRLSGTVASATVDHYLLEKTRCVSLNEGERNFHVFYQLVADSHLRADDRRLLNLGGRTHPPRDQPDDYQETLRSMRALSVPEDVIKDISSTLKGILAVGEARFESVEIPGQDAGSRMANVTSDASKCLGVASDDLAEAFVARRVAGVRVPNSSKQAEDARDGLLKALYARLFDKIVALVNSALGDDSSKPNMGKDERLFVGLLDIFGFESFASNSLEQLLINYANERLQAHFNNFVFETEAKLYTQEDIPVPPTAYVDNAGVVASLEDGVLRLLDEECALRRGSDQQFVAKLDRVSDGDVLAPYRGTARTGGELVGRAFIISHFAGKVTYTTDGFVAKNRDALPDAGASTLAASSNPLVASLFATSVAVERKGARAARRGNRRRECVAKAFGKSLRELTRTVESTRPQFVRCVKPNADQAPASWRGALVLEQLRYMGLLQVVEARRRGYPRRYSYEAFLRRFGKLCDMTHSPNREGAVCLVDALASSLSLERDAIVVGRTKVFLRARAEALIEGARDKALRKSALKELETAIEMENVDALEAAVAIATELRLDGSVLDRARSRVAVLRFRKHTASFKEIMKAILPDMHRDVLKDIYKNASVCLDDAARVAQAETTAAWAMAADIDTFKQILRRLRRKLRKLEERCKAAASLERAGNEVMETCRDLELVGEDAMRVLENARADLETAHKAAEESGVPPTAPEALIALKAADVLAVAFDRHLQQAEEEKAERDAFLDHMREGQEEGKDADSPATLARRSAVEVDLDAVPPTSPPTSRVREMKPPPVPPPPEVTVTPPDSLPDDDVQVIVPKPPAYADEARPATWLSDAEQHACQALSSKVSSAIVVADDPERRARALALERPAVKLQKNGSEWKRVVVEQDALVWRNQKKSSFSPRSTGTVKLKDVERVCLGPEVPRKDGEGGLVDEYHLQVKPSHRAASRWHYVTVTTVQRDYVFGLIRSEDEDDDAWSFALHLERQCDFFAGRSRPFGAGVLARAQRVWQEDDAYSTSRPLSRLCPALRPLAPILASLSETSFKSYKLPRGAAFGASAPASHAPLAWLPCAVLDQGCRSGLAFGTTFDPCEPRPVEGPYPALVQCEKYVQETCPALASTNITSSQRRPTPQSPRSPAQNAAQALRKRPSAKRQVPDRPKPVHLFAACAMGDPDLVEALVLRCRVKVDARYPQEDPQQWAQLCPQQADAEPHEGTTALCYVVTWCDVLGEANVEKVARRLMLLRADPALDDGHPDVRFPPLCAAVANGSTQLALLLLHAGSDPDVRTSDGRQAIHVLNLTRKEEDRATLLEALVNAGADVNATTNSGDAACHVAAREGLHDVLCRLLEFGANMMAENGDGLTPAEVAYVELQGDSSKDAGALQRCHELLA